MYIWFGSYWYGSTGIGVSYINRTNKIVLIFEAKVYGHGKYLGFVFSIKFLDIIACRYLINIVFYWEKKGKIGKNLRWIVIPQYHHM